jgi:hypothetical protein
MGGKTIPYILHLPTSPARQSCELEGIPNIEAMNDYNMYRNILSNGLELVAQILVALILDELVFNVFQGEL